VSALASDNVRRSMRRVDGDAAAPTGEPAPLSTTLAANVTPALSGGRAALLADGARSASRLLLPLLPPPSISATISPMLPTLLRRRAARTEAGGEVPMAAAAPRAGDAPAPDARPD